MATFEYVSSEPEPQASLPSFLQRLIQKSKSRAFWMLADQAVVSIGNFATANLLGRFLLPPAAYGGYQIILETLLFLNGLQAALVVYPMTIQGATGNHRKLQTSATMGMIFTLVLLPALGAVMWWAGASGGSWTVAASATAAMLLWQIQETFRRGLIAEFRIALCLPGDAISYIGQALAVWALHAAGRLDVTSAFLAIGATSLAALVIQALQIGLARVGWKDAQKAAIEWWLLGRWMLLNNLTTIITGVGFFWVLRYFWKLPSVAVFAAISQPLKLTNPIILSITGLITPAVAHSFVKDGVRGALRSASRYAGLAAAIVLPIYLCYFVLPAFTLKCFYGSGSPYVRDADLLRLWAFYFLVTFPGSMLSATLAGLKQSRSQFMAGMLHVVTVALIALPATAAFGVRGLIWSGIVTTLIDIAALGYFLKTAVRRLSEIPHGDETRVEA